MAICAVSLRSTSITNRRTLRTDSYIALEIPVFRNATQTVKADHSEISCRIAINAGTAILASVTIVVATHAEQLIIIAVFPLRTCGVAYIISPHIIASFADSAEGTILA